MGIMLTLGVLGDKPWPPVADTVTAQGIGGVRSSHAAGGAGARKRGAPESPVFCGAKNAPK
jgi:hypothetical protein